MGKIKATLTHLAISLCVFAIFLSLVFFIWYAYPFYITEGIGEIVYMMAGIDVVLGPLLTFIVYKQGKKSLKFDLSVIAAVQIVALVYGASLIYNERPGYIVFNVTDFSVVGANEVDMQKSSIPEQKVGIFEKPQLIYVRELGPQEVVDHVAALMNGETQDVERSPQYYRDYAANRASVIERTSVNKLVDLPETNGNSDEFYYAIVIGRQRNVVALINKNSGDVAGYDLNLKPLLQKVEVNSKEKAVQ